MPYIYPRAIVFTGFLEIRIRDYTANYCKGQIFSIPAEVICVRSLQMIINNIALYFSNRCHRHFHRDGTLIIYDFSQQMI